VLHIRYFGKNSIFNKEYGIQVFKVENQIVFTTGEKLFTYDDINDSIISYDRLNRDLGKYATAHRIINAGNHHYWFITPDDVGLFFFELNKISLVKEYPLELFGRRVIEGYENIVPLTGRRGILCLENGYVMLNADTADLRKEIDNLNILPRKIAMYGRKGNEQRLPLHIDKIKLSFRKNNLQLQYAFPYYSLIDVKYKYIMVGLTESWSEAMSKPEIDLERIPAGSYVLKVVAINAWNEESEIYEINIDVSPPWYNSVISWIIYVIILISIIFMVRYFAIKKTKRREKKKREMKEQELIKLRNQNLRNELSYKSRELASSTMAIIRKHEFLTKLKDILKRQKNELGSRYPDKYYNQIIEKIDKNISGGDDWKVFEANIEQAHEPFIQKMLNTYPQLSHSDLRLCTYLRMNLTSKEIAPLMHISVRGVENHRYRIRKKLNLDSDVNLTDFILAFEV
jgi:DNA-binding CsgD family transcriptional regulator